MHSATQRTTTKQNDALAAAAAAAIVVVRVAVASALGAVEGGALGCTDAAKCLKDGERGPRFFFFI